MSVRRTTAAALLAVLAFLPAVPARAATPEVPDQIVAAWSKDRVYVDERLRPAMPEVELTRIRAAAKAADFPVYIALVPETPYLRETLYDMPTLLQARTGQPGLYIVEVVSSYWRGVEELYRPGGLRGRTLTSVRGDDKQRFDLDTDRPAPDVIRTIQQAQTAYDGRPLPPVAAEDLEPARPGHGKSATLEEDRVTFVGLGTGGLLGFLLTLLLALHRKRLRRPLATQAAGQRPNVYTTEIRRQADSMIKRASQAVKRIESKPQPTLEQLDRRDDANRRLAAARKLRAGDPDDLLAVAGALVLARQAERGATGAPVQPPCFFNPIHKSGTQQVDWDGVEVPACRLCEARIAKDETPRGLFVKSVPYWTLDPEKSPLVATGFGALSDDLPERIIARAEDRR
ncbi:hypothetical protein ABZS29_08880 [Kribbella sp. NPDC005582]|uniref:hypothetical protein n=1 Tax=Kribbella sp. NPDC005582 TaxID=3156893 RepID=UPI0033BA2430